MPISRFPRRGYPIAPSLLARFLDRRLEKFAIRLNELTAKTCESFDDAMLRRLASRVVGYLAPQVEDIEHVVGASRIFPEEPTIELEAIELEVRTYNCLTPSKHGGAIRNIATLTIADALNIRGFGIRSLVDLLSSAEGFIAARCVDGTLGIPRDGEPENISPRAQYRDECRSLLKLVCRGTSIPRSVLGSRLPALPPDFRLSELPLQYRTRNVLGRVGILHAPSRLVELTIGELLDTRGFGAGCLIDLLMKLCSNNGSTVARGISSGPQLRGKQPDDGRILLKLLRSNGPNLKQLLASSIPPLPPCSEAESLELGRRTRTVLGREGLLRDAPRLAHMTIGDLLSLRGFGIGCLIDLVEDICRVREAAEDAGSPSPSRIGEATMCIDAICSIAGGTAIHESDPRLGKMLQRVHSGIVWAGDLGRLREQATIFDKLRALRQLRDAIEGCAGETVETEFEEIAVGKKASPRNRTIFREFYGFTGTKAATLRAVGERHQITRERVRQICAPPRVAHLSHPPFAPVIDKAIGVINEAIPDRRCEIERSLKCRRLIGDSMSLHNLRRIALFLKRSINFDFIGTGASQFVVPVSQVSIARRIRLTARKVVRQFGAVAIEEMMDRSTRKAPEPPALGFVESVITSIEGFEWLGDPREWFWLGAEKSMPLISRIMKVMFVCDSIAAGELRAAIRRDHRLGARVPLVAILLEVCNRLPGLRTEAGTIISVGGDDRPSPLRGDEAKIVGLLKEIGPVCRRDRLQEAAVASGMGVPSFWRCIQFCTTISRFAPNVYGLTGARVTAGAIAELSERREHVRVVNDHGWTANGLIWVAYRISAPMIHSGVFGIPAAKRNLVAGEFRIVSPAGSDAGTLVVEKGRAWGVGPFLRRSGAEPSDCMLTQFNTTEMVVIIKLGDDSVLEEFIG